MASDEEDEDAAIPSSNELFSYVYHQLALSFYIRAMVTTCTEEQKNQLLSSSMSFAKKAVATTQDNSIYWNTLGLVAFHLSDVAFAQHCYVKSLSIDSNNVVAWVNLGLLYFKQDKYLLAHKAFAKGQSVAPVYAGSWMGQGLCAEALAPGEAPDLFRHACLLKPHPFAIASYGNAVSDILLKSGKQYGSEEDHQYLRMHFLYHLDAVTHLYDLISRIERRAPTPQLFNLKGIVSGCNGFYHTALDSFNQTLKESENKLEEEEHANVHSNKVSALVALKKYDEAKDELLTLSQLDQAGLTNAALTMFKLNDASTAVNMYERILELPSVGEKKSDVKIALALIYNITQGVDTAKTILFGRDMLKNPRALITLGAMAVAHGELNLLKAVIHELRSYRWTASLAPDIAFLHACYEILQNNFNAAVKVILKFIHMYPTSPKLYALACQVILAFNLDSFKVSIPRHLALCTLKIARTIGTSREESLFASKHSGVVSLTYLVESSTKVAIMSTLKALRCYPENRDNWAVLAYAYWTEYSKNKDNSNLQNKYKLLNVINILDREIKLGICSQKILSWMSTFRMEIAKQSVSGSQSI